MNLTSQMAQLRATIDSLRDGRVEARAALAATVSQMREGFQTARADMAEKLQRDLHAFTSHLRQHVADLRGVIADDLAGARAAWLGHPRMAARPPKTYAETKVPPTETVAPKARKSKRY